MTTLARHALRLLASLCGATFRSRLSLQMEVVVLRQQLAVYRRTIRRPPLFPEDRLFWSWVSRRWASWREALVLVQPATVIAWQRRRFGAHWARLSAHRHPGRPEIPEEVKALIRRISSANPRWGSPRILGELQKLGVAVAKSTVEKYRFRHCGKPSPGWKIFLDNHLKDMVSIDFFTVPTVGFKVLFVLLILWHDRRRVVSFGVTGHPTAQWTAAQVVDAFSQESAPAYLLRDRDSIYGKAFQQQLAQLGIEQMLSAPRSPWQNAYVERMIGTIRRECLDHVVVLNEQHLRRILARYLGYYHRWRTHLSLSMDAPESRATHPPEQGSVVEFVEVGGLHHHYERIAA